ncbi:ATP-binding cassette domain-containing protein [Archaeoglobus neptunius]|uniref:ATP-binding cassette domain-containing protein n=1 Tax=Archaeoglobus neptunius TaxID=2798580 RepID=UPI001925D77E|nr:ATP-binding cassette domain-containing protein [Archaeoglobus neptunius]
MLKLIDVSKVYDGNAVLRGISLEVDDLVGIYGPNGSGKSTLLRIIAGIERPTCGRILFENKDITGLPPQRIAKMGIATVFQIPRPFKRMTVVENIAAVVADRGYREAVDEAYRICRFIGLDGVTETLASRLSQGELKLLEIGKALALNPKFMLIDEPFSGLDVENARKVVRLVRKIKKKGIPGIITAHRMKLLRDVADRCYEIRGGKIAES